MNTAPNRRARAARSAPAAQGVAANRTMLVPRDLPVLFQMPDVTRDRATRPLPEPPKTPSAPPPLSEPKSPEVNLVVTTAPPAVAPPITQTIPAPAEPPPETKPVETKPAATFAPAAKVERKPEPRRVKEGTWFDGQGKLITVCFLIALIATIYFARAGREPSPARTTAWPETHPGDAAGTGGAPPPATSVEPPMLTVTPPASEAPKAELLPPIENFPPPTLAAEPAPPPAEPSPTPPEEPRTAALPPPVAPPPVAPPPVAPPPVAPPPVAPPAEPPPARSGGTYGAPPPEYPGYPATNPSSYPPHQFGPPGPPAGPPTGSIPNPAAPSPSYSGAGYERTGSGLY